MTAPNSDDTEAKRMLSDVATAVETEITAHFGLEEEELFPILDAAGYTGLGEALMACPNHATHRQEQNR